ncbi:MAG: hypothetical protein KC618_07445, partial [Candidatus Omnitrophica bacterium]|nr:hypothetical protein [Candidatus Omnitrophota bacterium]
MEGKIQRSELNGVNVEDVVTNLGTGDLIYIDIDPVEGKLYWSEAGIPGAIIRSNLDGSFPEVVLSNATSFITNPTIDPINKKVYWIQNIGEIKRANFDGSEAETVVAMPSPGPILSDIELDMNGKLYWLAFLDATTSIIERINLENMEREVITDDTVFPARALAVHRADSKVYWITDAIGVRNSIWRMNLDGSQREKVIDLRSTGSFERSGKLEIDSEAGRLYWAQHYTISRTELSGARLEIVHEEDPSTRPFFDMEIVKFTIPEQISDIFIGDVVSQQLVTAGGTAPYEWTIKEGALPSGLTLSADGLLEGIADKLGTFRFTLQ